MNWFFFLFFFSFFFFLFFFFWRAFLPLLGYDQLCRKVIIMRPGSFDPALNKPMIVEKANFMVGEVMCHLDPIMFITGVVLIVDMKGYDVNHMAYRSLPMLKKYMRYTQVRISALIETIVQQSNLKSRSKPTIVKQCSLHRYWLHISLFSFKEAAPLRPQSLHFINMSSSLNTVYSLIMGFASDKIKKRVSCSQLASLDERLLIYHLLPLSSRLGNVYAV